MTNRGQVKAHRVLIRLGLLGLGSVQLALGLWLLADQRGFYETFPGGGLQWASSYGPYNAHLLVDAGALFAALGALLLTAAWRMDKSIVRIALVAYLIFQLPHFVFHFGADEALPEGESLASTLILAGTVSFVLLLLVLTGRQRRDQHRRAAVRPGGARIEPRNMGILEWPVNLYARRQFGGEVAPAWIYAHQPRVMIGNGLQSLLVESSNAVEPRLTMLAGLRAATLVNCEWCIDFGSHLARREGARDDQLRDLSCHRESDAFDPLEKLVLDYATAMTMTPADVDDELFGRMREHFDDRQLVLLTAAIAAENQHARLNHALGIAPQGFSAGQACALPARLDPPEAAAPGGSPSNGQAQPQGAVPERS